MAEAGRGTHVACGRCGASRTRWGCQCSEARRQGIGTSAVSPREVSVLRSMGSGDRDEAQGHGIRARTQGVGDQWFDDLIGDQGVSAICGDEALEFLEPVAAGQSNMAEQSQFDPRDLDAENLQFVRQALGVESAGWISGAKPFVFSTVATHFSNFIQPYVGVPVGVLLAAESSTLISYWHPQASRHNFPRRGYDFLIRPIQPYPIKGIIWWQGESDAL